MHLFEKTVESKEVVKTRILDIYQDKAELENGEIAVRDVVKHPGGVCVVALDENNNVFFVSQFRYPFKSILLEIPAGKLEWGENPLDCGRRELHEEGGVTADVFISLGKLYPTPAYCTEIIYMYLARGLHAAEQQLDGDEFLDVEKIPLDKAVEMVNNNEIEDAKTQLAILKAYMYIHKEK